MDDEVYAKYRRAGKIAAEARDYGMNLIKSGFRLLEVANKVESKIREQGAGIAFPVNISINELAAHFSPRHDDVSVFKRGDVVKLDVGAHVDGYIADTAVTVEVETTTYADMIRASREALSNAIAVMKDNVKLADVGKTIEDRIVSYGYKPINNLTGHSLERYSLHSGLSIPNISNTYSRVKPHVGDVVAIEPFATNGAGHVSSGKGSNIYCCGESLRSKLMRDQQSRLLFKKLSDTFLTLPFAERWCIDTISNIDTVLKKLIFLGAVKQYPQLVDDDHGIVTQAEHTVIITHDGCEVIT
jgi:methionyl aminopeptidase